MSQNAKDKIIFLLSGLMIGLGATAFVYNFRTIQSANAESQPGLNRALSDFKNLAQKNRRSLLSDPFFDRDSVMDMRELRNRFFQGIGSSSLFPNRESFFSSQDFQFPKTSRFNIEQSETPEYVIYEVTMEGAGDGSAMDVDVEEGMVNIRGHRVDEVQDNRNQVNQSFYSSSTLSQSFSLPSHLDYQNVVIENKGRVVILKFPKLNSES